MDSTQTSRAPPLVKVGLCMIPTTLPKFRFVSYFTAPQGLYSAFRNYSREYYCDAKPQTVEITAYTCYR